MAFNKSKRSAALLNLLIPGLGHIYWKEYLFGIFIFLVTLIAVILFILSFFISINKAVFWVVGLMPLIFYLFTFVDLFRTMKKKQIGLLLNKKTYLYFLLFGIAYQLFSPTAPVNFLIRNHPELYTVEQNNLSPLFQQGNLLMASSLAYKVDLFFIDKPVLYDFPDRYQPVRFKAEGGRMETGIVLGFPEEEIEIAEGVVVVNGYPDIEEPPGNLVLRGYCQLTTVEPYSIMIATLNLGSIDKIYMVSFADLTGKVTKLF